MSEKQAVATIEPSKYALIAADPQIIGQIMRENVGGAVTEFTFDRVRVPGAGGLNWEVPSLSGIQEEKTITGIIVYNTMPRAYWRTSFDDGGGAPPDCSARDGQQGIGDPGGECQRCPLSKFGSAPPKKGQKESRGQACRQMRMLFVIRPQSLMPLVVVAPPTSLQEIGRYFLRLAGEAVPYYGVISALSLVKDKNKDGTVYSRIVPTMVKRLEKEEVTKIKAYGANLRAAFDTVALTPDDVKHDA